ncbi:UNVERIFIED_ORG: hypothetical protein EOZ59_1218 [Serratia quinivorans]
MLTDTQCRTAKPKEKLYRLNDFNGEQVKAVFALPWLRKISTTRCLMRLA